jgi:Flp pilus assembly pilin Flp
MAFFSKISAPRRQLGISAIEYLVLAVVVIAVISAAATALGVDITAAFAAIGDLINP